MKINKNKPTKCMIFDQLSPGNVFKHPDFPAIYLKTDKASGSLGSSIDISSGLQRRTLGDSEVIHLKDAELFLNIS